MYLQAPLCVKLRKNIIQALIEAILSPVCKATFEQLFPKFANQYSVIQALVVDLRNNSSRKTESLVLRMEFAGNNRSPQHQQIVVLSVHPTGQLQNSLDNTTGRWVWNFVTRTYEGS